MDNKELKKKLVEVRDSIQDYLDNLDMDEIEVKSEKGKPEKGKSDKDKESPKEEKED